jgi:hypothetical protein
MAATATSKPDSKKKGKGPWMTETEEKLAASIELGVRSSTKADTREFRVQFYLEQLAAAKVQVAYYEELLRLEEQKGSLGIAERRSTEHEDECAKLEAEIRLLTLREQAGQLRSGQAARATDDDDRTVVPDSSVRVSVKGEQQWQRV